MAIGCVMMRGGGRVMPVYRDIIDRPSMPPFLCYKKNNIDRPARHGHIGGADNVAPILPHRTASSRDIPVKYRDVFPTDLIAAF